MYSRRLKLGMFSNIDNTKVHDLPLIGQTLRFPATRDVCFLP